MKPINQRCCISCRKLASKSSFWRVVRCYDTGQVLLDNGMGRSAYLCPTRSCLELAQKKRRLERSLRIAVAPIIYQTLESRLRESEVR